MTNQAMLEQASSEMEAVRQLSHKSPEQKAVLLILSALGADKKPEPEKPAA